MSICGYDGDIICKRILIVMDSASGLAISMELARAMGQGGRLQPYIRCRSGKGQGLYDSNFLAQTYEKNSTDVQAIFIDDIVGPSTSGCGSKVPLMLSIFAQGVL